MKIALIGKMRSGKDTVAEYIINNYNFTRFAFGDELKRHYHEIFGHTDSKFRNGYQWFGQAMREHNPDIWVSKCFDKIKYSSAINVVVSDLRQPNEYIRCKEEGFKLIKVYCEDDIRLKRMQEKNDSFTEKDLYHETEMHIDTFDYDYLIVNDGTLEKLNAQIESIIRSINNE